MKGSVMADKVVRAERFEVVDNSGQTRMIMGMSKDNTPGWALYDQNGNRQIRITLTDSGALDLELGNSLTNGSMKISLEKDAVKLHISENLSDTPILKFERTPTGGIVLSIHDNNGTPRSQMGVADDGTSFQSLSDEQGKTKAIIALSQQGDPVITLHDDDKNIRTMLGLNREGQPAIATYDKELGITWKTP
jgi:hypothetical protein